MAKEQTFERLEIKYLLNDIQYHALLPELLKIAEKDQYGKSRINNIYFDTPSFRIIRTSLEKPVYKEKLRLRTYGDTSDDTNAFIEIKKKYRGVVYKRRISAEYINAMDYLTSESGRDSIPESQVKEEINEFLNIYTGLHPAMIIGYDRIALAGINDKDFRVTFDTNITWRTTDIDLRKGTDGRQILKPGQHLMEIKIPDAFPLELSRKMSELGIFPVSISKYGRAYTDMIKQMMKSNIKIYDYETINNVAYNKGFIKKGEVAYA
ncbi:MAG: polyphosphate polymerase domain-containing protein [Eubacterium sp.]|nr:polyphosphate polymerase domain-containing protein [Eubacterium sp.]